MRRTNSPSQIYSQNRTAKASKKGDKHWWDDDEREHQYNLKEEDAFLASECWWWISLIQPNTASDYIPPSEWMKPHCDEQWRKQVLSIHRRDFPAHGGAVWFSQSRLQEWSQWLVQRTRQGLPSGIRQVRASFWSRNKRRDLHQPRTWRGF